MSMEWDKKYVKTQSYKNGIFLDNILSYVKEYVNTYTNYVCLYISDKRTIYWHILDCSEQSLKDPYWNASNNEER